MIHAIIYFPLSIGRYLLGGICGWTLYQLSETRHISREALFWGIAFPIIFSCIAWFLIKELELANNEHDRVHPITLAVGLTTFLVTESLHRLGFGSPGWTLVTVTGLLTFFIMWAQMQSAYAKYTRD